MTLEEKIIQILEEKKIEFEIIEHEPVYTNPAMAEALGVTEAETVKSLVLSTKEKETVVLVMPGNKRVNWKGAAEFIGTKKVSFAKPDRVKELVGCDVGCVPPIGHFTKLPVFWDSELSLQTHVYFNPGVHHRSFKITSQNMELLCKER